MDGGSAKATIMEGRGRSSSSALETLSLFSSVSFRSRSSSQSAVEMYDSHEVKVVNPLFKPSPASSSSPELGSPVTRPRKSSFSFLTSSPLATTPPTTAEKETRIVNPIFTTNSSTRAGLSSSSPSIHRTCSVRIRSPLSPLVLPKSLSTKSEKIRTPLLPLINSSSSLELYSSPSPSSSSLDTSPLSSPSATPLPPSNSGNLQEGYLTLIKIESRGETNDITKKVEALPKRYWCELTKHGLLSLKQEKGTDFRGDTDLLIYLLGGQITEHIDESEQQLLGDSTSVNIVISDASSDTIRTSDASTEQKHRFALYCPLQLPQDRIVENTPRETEQIATTYLFEVEEEFDYFNWMVKLKKITTLLESKQRGSIELEEEEEEMAGEQGEQNGNSTSDPANKEQPQPLTKRKIEEKIEKEGMLLFKKETKKTLQKIKQRSKKWKRCLVLLQDFYLTVFNVDKEKTPIVSISVLLCSPRVAKIKTKKNYCFEVVHAEATLHFAAETGQIMMDWIGTIQVAQARSMVQCLDYKLDIKKSMAEEETQSKAKLASLLSLPENRTCADCDAQEPIWASTNLGVFICLACSGPHRALGVHISKVRSVTMDKWDSTLLRTMEEMGGNAKCNQYWEANLVKAGCDNVNSPPELRHWKKPSSSSSLDEKQKFINAKYRDKLFVRSAS
eukprot:TRINITY_DN2226_c0_g1_i1.p1 TRINITY_DN2226_c0_g1~~TRINITY_DN2226_c0_g1_i1.p1  ORF type:complete len:674 (-),score=145.27 TRINITY_DN2226_c0_g1_i1:80-2101(-)